MRGSIIEVYSVLSPEISLQALDFRADTVGVREV